ncbi:MAG TPA: hypothetical protein VMH91_00610 [Candidatus Paceibacterota bacterium]|nr:hypothetical protein [Candidatus Paceibacterota bacterium]
MRFEQLYPKRTPEEEQKRADERAPEDAKFSEQWKHPQEITTPLGEKIDLYDMRPEHEKTPVPTLLVSGFTGTAELWKKNMRELYTLGRRTLVVDGSHGVDYDPNETNLDKRAMDPEYRKVAAMSAALDGAHVEKADAVAHSKGCIDLVLAAYAYPERFRNIVLIEPAGMNPNESLVQVIWRNQLKDVPSMNKAHEAYKRGDPGYQWDIHPEDSVILDLSKEITQHPIQVVKELYSIANVRVIDLLRKVKEKGIGIVIVQSPEDEMFRAEVMTGEVSKNEAGEVLAGENGKVLMEKQGSLASQKLSPDEDITKVVDGFYSVKGHHTRFYDQPKEYTQLIDGALTALAAKKGEF